VFDLKNNNILMLLKMTAQVLKELEKVTNGPQAKLDSKTPLLISLISYILDNILY
jgi:hypothetical protein